MAHVMQVRRAAHSCVLLSCLQKYKRENILVNRVGDFWEISTKVLNRIEVNNYLENKLKQNNYLRNNPKVAIRKGINLTGS